MINNHCTLVSPHVYSANGKKLYVSLSSPQEYPADVYQRIMDGIVEAEKLYNEYGKKATYVSVTKPR